MLKKIIIIVFIIVIILFTNSLLELEYDMNLLEYINSNNPLSEAEIKILEEQKTLIYGADYNSPPLRYVNDRTNQYEGLSIDYISALSVELGINIEFKPLMWSDALEKLKTGEIDICDMYPSEERAKDFLFSSPIYYQRGAVLIKKSNTEIKTVSDLENKIISGNKGDYVFEFIDLEFDNIKGVESSDLRSAILLLTQGKVDAVLGDESVMNYIINKEQLKNEYIILNDYLYEREAVLAVSKDKEELLNILNKSISNLNKKKTMEMIDQKWFGISPLITKSTSNKKILLISRYIFIIAGVLGIGLYAWNIQLKKEVQKQTSELRVSKNELQTVFNGLTHLMIVIDEDCNIVDGNKTFCERYQIERNDIDDKHCKQINGIMGSECEECIIKKTFNVKQSQIKEIRHDTRIYKVSTYVLEQIPDTKNKILVMMEDITEFKFTEKEMLQSTKMAAIGKLSAGIAHEIRTPLGIIRNNIYYMKRSSSEDDYLESINVIESSVSRANKIIDNLLNFSKLTDNKISESNIYDLVSDIINLNKKFFITKKINSKFICSENLVISINVESFKHVMINLINNAVDAMKDGGDLLININIDNKVMDVIVSDSGKGMDEEVLNSIFDPFYTTKKSGTGLGLYITYNEVQKMKGTIFASSKENIGTTFTLAIPEAVMAEEYI